MAGAIRGLGMGKVAHPGETPARGTSADARLADSGASTIRPCDPSDDDIDLVALTEPEEETCRPCDQPSNLATENAVLRQRVASLEELLSDALDKSKYWAEQYHEYVSLLEEKSEVIRELHLKIQTLQSTAAAPLPAATPREADLLALSEELEKEKAQLSEDEAALMQQMRSMEIQMSKERADLARQRADIQRLHNEMQHELELANREAALRDRLQPLMRRQQELVRSGSSEPPPANRNGKAATEQTPTPPPTTSGIFRRLFS